MFEGIRCNPMLDDFLALARRGSETPDAIAILAPGRDSLTYRDLWERIQTLQNVLRPGEVTALVLSGGPGFILAFLAAASTGACAPLDPVLTENEYHSHLSRLGARTLIVSGSDQTAAIRAALSLGIRILTMDAAVTISVLDPGDAAISGRATHAALLLFTSATTDSPKLVPLTWQNLHAMAIHDSRALQLTAADRVLCLMPLFHLHGLATVLTQLSRGGSVILHCRVRARKFSGLAG